MAEHTPAVLEGNSEALLFELAVSVLKLAHTNVCSVARGLTHVLLSRLHKRQLVAHFSLIFINYL